MPTTQEKITYYTALYTTWKSQVDKLFAKEITEISFEGKSFKYEDREKALNILNKLEIKINRLTNGTKRLLESW